MGYPIEEFLTRVVPWPQTPEAPGLINLHWTSPKDKDPKTGKIKGMHGRPFRDVKDLINFSQWLATNNHIAHDVYFCLSSQVSPGKKYGDKYAAMRHARNVLALKALWLDVDVKPDKGYPTTVAAVEALHKFIADAKLPPISALVLSGSGGMHVYWISDKPLSVEEWRPYAEGLEALRNTHGFKADAGLSTDCVRLLRVPGTFNFKNSPPRGVALKLLGADVNFEQALGHIRVTGPVTNPLVAAGAVAELPFDPALFPRRPPLPAGHESLADGIHIHDDTPLDWAGLVKAGGCPHFQDALRTGGKDYEQGLWMLDVLACTFLQDGRELARKVSNGYETYTASETDAMYARKVAERKERGLGWPSCDAFEHAGCKSCATCPLKATIKSPLLLAARATTPIHAVAIPKPAGGLFLPDGYGVNREGHIVAIAQKVMAGGLEVPVPIPMFACRLRDPQLLGGDKRGIRFEAELDPGIWDLVTISEADQMYDDRLVMKALWGKHVKVWPKGEPHIRHFLVAWFQKLSAEMQRLDSVPLGWVFDKTNAHIPVGFAYDGKVYRSDGSSHFASAPDKEIESTYCVAGSKDQWLKAMDMVIGEGRPGQQCLIALAFAAPLMLATGHYACILSIWSRGGGAHKTTALRTGAAVWGNPHKAKESLGASEKGILKKLSELHNLPLFWDEVSGKEEDMLKAANIASMCTEGAEGAKLRSTRDFHVKGMWQTLIAICANMSLWDVACAVNRSTDAKVRRIFEIELDTKESDRMRQSEVDYVMGTLDYNHGHAGREYAQFLGRNAARVIEDTRKCIASFEDAVKVKDADRYWIAVCACLIAGAGYANELCGATKFDIPGMTDFLIGQFYYQRRRVHANVSVASSSSIGDIFAQWIKLKGENQIWIARRPHAGRGKQLVQVYRGADTNNAIDLQWIVEEKLLRISQTRFVTWVMNNPAYKGFTETTLLGSLRQHWGARTDIPRQNLAAYCGYAANGAETVVEIPIPDDHEYATTMHMHDPHPAVTGSVTAAPAVATPATATTSVGATGTAVQIPGGSFATAMAQAQSDMRTILEHAGR